MILSIRSCQLESSDSWALLKCTICFRNWFQLKKMAITELLLYASLLRLQYLRPHKQDNNRSVGSSMLSSMTVTSTTVSYQRLYPPCKASSSSGTIMTCPTKLSTGGWKKWRPLSRIMSSNLPSRRNGISSRTSRLYVAYFPSVLLVLGPNIWDKLIIFNVLLIHYSWNIFLSWESRLHSFECASPVHVIIMLLSPVPITFTDRKNWFPFEMHNVFDK